MDWIRPKLESLGDRVAGIESGCESTFSDFLERVDAFAATIRESTNGQQVVAIETRGVLDGLAGLLACHATGQIALPLPAELEESERAHMRSISGAELVLERAEGGDLEAVALSADAKPPLYAKLNGKPGLVLFSSGTSGAPKGMVHDLNALLDRFRSVRPRSDRTLQLLLTDHIGGLDAAFRSLFAGSTIVVPEERTAEAAGAAIEAHRVNVLPASPTFLNLLLLAGIPGKFDCSSVEIIAYGAEPMPQALLGRISTAFPNADLQQKFGTSETGAIRTKSAGREDLSFRIDDPDTEWKAVDGELWLRTPSRILGYLNADESALEAEGWYRTGDLVTVDGERITVVGRLSEVINVGGRKVHPSEVEAVISEIPEVEATAVHAVSDPIQGNAVACDIVARNDASPLEWKRSIRAFCRGKLPAWKIPSHVNLKKELTVTDRLKRG